MKGEDEYNSKSKSFIVQKPSSIKNGCSEFIDARQNKSMAKLCKTVKNKKKLSKKIKMSLKGRCENSSFSSMKHTTQRSRY